MPSIGQRIKSRRVELGMSADDVASKLGKNRATVYRYESDDIENLPITVIGPLAEVLETSPAFLMGWDDVDTEKKPVPSTGDELEHQIFNLFASLPDQKKKEALSYLQYLARPEEK